MHFKQVSLTDNSLSSDYSPWKSLLQIHNIFSILWKHWKFHELFLKVSCSAEWLSVIGGMFNGLTWPPEAKPNVKIKHLNCMLALRFLIWNVQKWAVPPFIRLKLGYSPNFKILLSFNVLSYFQGYDICFTRHNPIFCDPCAPK